MASVQDQILRKRERESLLLGSLPGATRALRNQSTTTSTRTTGAACATPSARGSGSSPLARRSETARYIPYIFLDRLRELCLQWSQLLVRYLQSCNHTVLINIITIL